jgi:flagellar assembly protein FliH
VSADSLERTQRLLHDVIACFRRQREQLLLQIRPAVVTLVVALATEVVGRELATDERAVLQVVERALAELGREGRTIVRVSPADAQTLRDAMDAGEWLAPVRAELEVVADVSVSRGGCVLDSDYGQIDATVETQVAELARLLVDSGPDSE